MECTNKGASKRRSCAISMHALSESFVSNLGEIWTIAVIAMQVSLSIRIRSSARRFEAVRNHKTSFAKKWQWFHQKEQNWWNQKCQVFSHSSSGRYGIQHVAIGWITLSGCNYSPRWVVWVPFPGDRCASKLWTSDKCHWSKQVWQGNCHCWGLYWFQICLTNCSLCVTFFHILPWYAEFVQQLTGSSESIMVTQEDCLEVHAIWYSDLVADLEHRFKDCSCVPLSAD